MTSRLITLFFLMAGLSAAGFAQSACQSVEVPVSVIGASGATFRGLGAADFATAKNTGTVKSAAWDEGARRVLIIVDTNKKLSGDARRAEIELVSALVAAARPQDSLALITSRGPGGRVRFGDDRSGIVPALSQPGDSSQSQMGPLDAVKEGLEWFSGSQPGDAIVLIAADLDGNHRASAKSVAKALAEHHVRMFGLGLGPIQTSSSVAGGSMTSTTSQGLAWTTPMTGSLIANTGDENFFPLTVNSGGMILSVVGGSDQPENLNDPRVMQLVKQKAHVVLSIISAFYRLQVESPKPSHPQPWSLDVSESRRKSQPRMWLLYPHELGPC